MDIKLKKLKQMQISRQVQNLTKKLLKVLKAATLKLQKTKLKSNTREL